MSIRPLRTVRLLICGLLASSLVWAAPAAAHNNCDTGTDHDYQKAVFNVYPELMRQTPA